jgi:hypothetical protein
MDAGFWRCSPADPLSVRRTGKRRANIDGIRCRDESWLVPDRFAGEAALTACRLKRFKGQSARETTPKSNEACNLRKQFDHSPFTVEKQKQKPSEHLRLVGKPL